MIETYPLSNYSFQVLKAEGLERYADVKSVTSELASAMDLTPEELEHVASELIEIASQRGEGECGICSSAL